MTRQRTVAITGSASGIGAATRARLEAAGQRVIGVDIRDADVIGDLGSPAGRQRAIDAVTEHSGGTLDGLVTCAGIAGLGHLPGSLLASVNYFGSVALHEGLRPLLARGEIPAAVVISSNSTTVQPDIPMDVVELCLAGDESGARAAADAAGALATYPATKTAVAWWARRTATGPGWAGAGINLNVVAPGAVETPMLQATRDDPFLGQFIDSFPIPLGRKGDPDEIAAFIAFLLGADARFICGSVLFVDGGSDAHFRADDFPRPAT